MGCILTRLDGRMCVYRVVGTSRPAQLLPKCAAVYASLKFEMATVNQGGQCMQARKKRLRSEICSDLRSIRSCLRVYTRVHGLVNVWLQVCLRIRLRV